MNYLCPVCGYPDLLEPPLNFSICPSCGTEFENDDYDQTHLELRLAWVKRGARWFSRATPPPPRWNAFDQLAAADLSIIADERINAPHPRVVFSSETNTSGMQRIKIALGSIFGNPQFRLPQGTVIDAQKVEICHT